MQLSLTLTAPTRDDSKLPMTEVRFRGPLRIPRHCSERPLPARGVGHGQLRPLKPNVSFGLATGIRPKPSDVGNEPRVTLNAGFYRRGMERRRLPRGA